MAVTAVVLAGGRARRFGGVDKPLIKLSGRALIDHTIARVAPQVDDLIISFNRNFEQYYVRGRTLVMDHDEDQGPIAGILAARRFIRTDHVLVIPADTPLLPLDLVAKLGEAAKPIAVPRTGARRQNLIVLMASDALDSMETFYRDSGRAMKRWLDSRSVAEVAMPQGAFANVNRREDLERLEGTLESTVR